MVWLIDWETLQETIKKNWVQGPKSFLEARLLIFSSKLVSKDICSESN